MPSNLPVSLGLIDPSPLESTQTVPPILPPPPLPAVGVKVAADVGVHVGGNEVYVGVHVVRNGPDVAVNGSKVLVDVATVVGVVVPTAVGGGPPPLNS